MTITINIRFKNQLGLIMPKLQLRVKERFYKIVIITIIIKARPFSLFSKPYIKNFIFAIFSNIYKFSKRYNIINKWLNIIYLKIKQAVDLQLATIKKFHFIFDELINVNFNKIINFLIYVLWLNAFFINNFNAGISNLMLAWFVEWFFAKVSKFISRD